jgi:rhodanese-related sulfurtransferase
MLKSIERDALRAALASPRPPVLVEALPRKYYDEGHLPGARHLPHGEVDALAEAVLPDRDAAVVVYCASISCRNSHIAAQRLVQIGYADVAVYAGGKADWQGAGLPIEQAAAPIEQR